MKFYSTNDHQYKVTLEEAVRLGLPPDSGLFMPEEIPVLTDHFLQSLDTLSLEDIGIGVLGAFMKEDLSERELKNICTDAFSFSVPINKVSDKIYALELYHGPTLAFKDFGARFMARLLAHFNKYQKRSNTILVATSGDTGSAVAHGFYKVPNVQVVILYPKGKVSILQEKQMTTLSENIHAIAVDGVFDDCQKLVKTAFLDTELNDQLGLTSANSINLARLLPQMIYYFYAYGKLRHLAKNIVFSVPSGNYGNLTAGLLSQRMGLPISHFLAAANANDVVPQYLINGIYKAKSSVETISNAMDVGDPSNFVRMLDLFDNSWPSLREDITGYSFSDAQTRDTMATVYRQFKYTLDPHGAIGYRALSEYNLTKDSIGVFLETAHPVKFKQSVEPVIGHALEIPASLKGVMNKENNSSDCANDYSQFKTLLVDLTKQ